MPADDLPLPHDEEAECAVLGSMLQWTECIPTVLGIIPPDCVDWFFDKDRRLVFSLIVSMYNSCTAIDAITFRHAYEERHGKSCRDSVDMAMRLIESVPSAVHAEYYAKIVREMAWRRDAIVKAAAVTSFAHAGDAGEPGSARERIERELSGLLARQDDVQAQDMVSLTAREFEFIESRVGQGIDGLATGFHALDDLLCGLHPGEVVLVAARPSQGKTAFGLQVASHVAKAVPTMFYSLEMAAGALMLRMMCASARVDSVRIHRGIHTTDDVEKLRDARDQLAKLKLLISDRKGVSLPELRSSLRYHHNRDGVGLAVIDYLQLMRTFGRVESRQQEVAAYSAGIKALAGDLNIPIVVLCQLNRNPEGRSDFRPRMSDLRESGSLEQDADVVMLLHREWLYHVDESQASQTWRTNNADKETSTEVIVAKNRNGPVGAATLHFSAEHTRFDNAARATDAFDYVPRSDEAAQDYDGEEMF